MRRALYYGCRPPGGGHAFFSPGMRRLSPQTFDETPWGADVDALLLPPGPQTEGRALMSYRDGWTALSFPDRSVDQRNGSHSTFLFEGATLDLPAAIAAARDAFPEVFERFGFEVVSA